MNLLPRIFLAPFLFLTLSCQDLEISEAVSEALAHCSEMPERMINSDARTYCRHAIGFALEAETARQKTRISQDVLRKNVHDACLTHFLNENILGKKFSTPEEGSTWLNQLHHDNPEQALHIQAEYEGPRRGCDYGVSQYLESQSI